MGEKKFFSLPLLMEGFGVNFAHDAFESVGGWDCLSSETFVVSGTSRN